MAAGVHKRREQPYEVPLGHIPSLEEVHVVNAEAPGSHEQSERKQSWSEAGLLNFYFYTLLELVWACLG